MMHLDLDEELLETLGNRMKRLEADALKLSESLLPAVIRLDGCHFHTWIKQAKLSKPFDDRMCNAMQKAALALCESIPGCIMAYVQSDEISLVLRPGESKDWSPWYGNKVQKLCSVSASVCAVAFNDEIRNQLGSSLAPPAFFDSRVIFMPNEEEVFNCLVWRQNDCIRNSVSALAQSLFSARELSGKKREEQLKMMLEKGVDWTKLPEDKKLGALVHKESIPGEFNGKVFTRSKFFIDKMIPKFTEDKDFLKRAYGFNLQ